MILVIKQKFTQIQGYSKQNNYVILNPMSYAFNDTATNPFEADEVELLTDEQFPYGLIVWNDNVNTFDWVIETLIEVCGHTPEQAEQCSLIIHFHGKCTVKNGDYDTLKPMCDAITERGIGATIEITVNS